MTNRERYQKTFSQIHSNEDIHWEAYQTMKTTGNSPRRLVLLAAVIGLLAVLSTVAVATDFFGLRALLLPQPQTITLPADSDTGNQEVQRVDVITLSGYQGSAESRALAAWREFLDSYDQDGALLAAVGNGPTGLDKRFSLYQVYTQAMAEKLEEIAAAYDLTLHTENIDLYEHPEAFASSGSFLGEGNRAYSASMYEDGTFHFDGEGDLPGYGTVCYQFMRCVKGSFTDVLLTIGEAAAYREWPYETACGQTVTLALSPDKALILADLGDSLITVNVLAGSGQAQDGVWSTGPLSAQGLETLADSFDFTELTPVVPPVVSETAGEDPLAAQTGVETPAAREFVRQLAELLENGDRDGVAALFVYPCEATVSAGTVSIASPEELLPCYDEVVEYQLKTLLGELMSGELTARNGLVGAGSTGAAWFGPTEDGALRLFTLQCVGGWGIHPAEDGVAAG